MRKEIEMMRILRVPPLAKLVVEANEERYESLSDVANPQVQQRLLAAIGELIAFSGGYGVLEEAGVVPQLTPLPVKTAEPTETAVPPELEEKQKAFLNDLENQLETEKSQPPAKKRGGIFIASETLSSPEPIVEITDTGVVKPKNIPVKLLTIAEQIDIILQKHVTANPALKDRDIRLEQNPAGGLVIRADGKSYEKPDDIEDVAVQEVIKAAVREWNVTK